jgi:acyl-CoA synthetase (AMP-forming)/AMP-acid ligase II
MGEITIGPETTVDDAQAQAVAAYADREAVVIGEERATFGELGERIDRLAAGLYKLGLQKGDVVVLFLPTCLEFVYLYWALSKVGAVVAPVNPLSRQAEIAHILADSEAKAVVFAPNVSGNDLMAIMQNVRGDLPNLSHLIVRGDDAPQEMIAFDSLMTSKEPRPPEGINEPDDLWALLYTTGTTGAPKGVMHTHRTAMGQLLGIAKLAAAMTEAPMSQIGSLVKLTLKYGTRYVKSAGKQRAMVALPPLYATGGHYCARSSLLMGDLFIGPEHFHPVWALEMIEREQASTLVATPSMFRLMLDVKDFDRYEKSSLLVVTSSMAYMPPKLAQRVRERFKCPLMIAYGTTEAGGVTATGLSDRTKVATETVGRAASGAEVKIVDSEHNEVPRGEKGEIAVKWAGIMAGYYKAPELTAQVLDDEGWYYSGDLGTMDEEGVFKIVGRKMEGQTVTPQEVLRHCRKDLTAFKVPSEVRIVDELPMAAGLKVQKYKLRRMAEEELAA